MMRVKCIIQNACNRDPMACMWRELWGVFCEFKDWSFWENVRSNWMPILWTTLFFPIEDHHFKTKPQPTGHKFQSWQQWIDWTHLRKSSEDLQRTGRWHSRLTASHNSGGQRIMNLDKLWMVECNCGRWNVIVDGGMSTVYTLTNNHEPCCHGILMG